MNREIQNKFMEQQLVGLTTHAADKGVGAYVMYGQYMAAAAGIGVQLDDELLKEVHKSLKSEFDGELDDMIDTMEDINDIE